MADQVESRQIDLVCQLSEGVPETLEGDPGRLRQVLVNLLANAIKFTARGHVELRVTADGPFLRFEVADTGIGIAPEAQARLFKTFSQVDSSMSRRYGGTGLGLAICKRLVVLMGGAIGVRSVAEECRSAGVPECRSAGVPECRSAGVPECRSAEVPECRSAGVPKCRSAGVPDGWPHR